MHSLQKCKINSEAKELKFNVVSVKLSQYLDNLICNQNLKWKQSKFMLWNHKHPYLEEILLFAKERAILYTIKRKNTLTSKATVGK